MSGSDLWHGGGLVANLVSTGLAIGWGGRSLGGTSHLVIVISSIWRRLLQVVLWCQSLSLNGVDRDWRVSSLRLRIWIHITEGESGSGPVWGKISCRIAIDLILELLLEVGETVLLNRNLRLTKSTERSAIIGLALLSLEDVLDLLAVEEGVDDPF